MLENVLGGPRTPEHFACEFDDGRAGRWYPACVECPHFVEDSPIPTPCPAYFAKPSYRPRFSTDRVTGDLIAPDEGTHQDGA